MDRACNDMESASMSKREYWTKQELTFFAGEASGRALERQRLEERLARWVWDARLHLIEATTPEQVILQIQGLLAGEDDV